MGPLAHGGSRAVKSAIAAMAARNHAYFRVAPCGFTEPQAGRTQVAMELHGKLTDNGHGSMVSWADLGLCRPGL